MIRRSEPRARLSLRSVRPPAPSWPCLGGLSLSSSRLFPVSFFPFAPNPPRFCFFSCSSRARSDRPRLSASHPRRRRLARSIERSISFEFVGDSSVFFRPTAAGPPPRLARLQFPFRPAAQRRCVAAAAQWIRAARRDQLRPAAGRFFEQRPAATHAHAALSIAFTSFSLVPCLLLTLPHPIILDLLFIKYNDRDHTRP